MKKTNWNITAENFDILISQFVPLWKTTFFFSKKVYFIATTERFYHNRHSLEPYYSQIPPTIVLGSQPWNWKKFPHTESNNYQSQKVR